MLTNEQVKEVCTFSQTGVYHLDILFSLWTQKSVSNTCDVQRVFTLIVLDGLSIGLNSRIQPVLGGKGKQSSQGQEENGGH